MLKIALAILVLLSISYGYAFENAIRMPFQSEVFFSKNSGSDKHAVSYKSARAFGISDSKESHNTFTAALDLAAFHNVQVRIKIPQKHKLYCSFKSSFQFFSTKIIPQNSKEAAVAIS